MREQLGRGRWPAFKGSGYLAGSAPHTFTTLPCPPRPSRCRRQEAGVAAARFQAALRVLSSLGPGVTQRGSKRDLQRWMSQLVTLAAEAPPALLTDDNMQLLVSVAAAAVSRAAGTGLCRQGGR